MADITDAPVFSVGAVLDTPDVTAHPVFSIGYSTVPVLFTLYVSSAVSSPTVGTHQVNATVTADGVAGASAVGTATARQSSVLPQGVPGGVSFGTVASAATVTASAIDAATGAVSEPRVADVMNPAGFAESTTFGDAATSSIVTIVPGPIDPSNDFGDAKATRYGWVFRNPKIQLGWRFQKRYEGVSLLKESGSWVEVSHPDLERTLSAQIYLPGGRDHVVSDSLKADLVAAGYTVTSEVVTTEEYK